MQTHDLQSDHFVEHYKQLELEHDANWEQARANYRRLVQVWHPDRFAQRPRERANAQKEFIKLTKSHTELRNFHRKHQRMPFQLARRVNTQHDAASFDDTYDSGISDVSDLSEGILHRSSARHKTSKQRSTSLKKIAWAVSGVGIMISTIVFFLILDRNANRANAERGREVVRQAPQSEFMPSASEIRRSQAREAFIKPTK